MWVEEKELLTADAILTTRPTLSDLLMKDLDAVETRLNRDPGEAEKAVLQKLADALMSANPDRIGNAVGRVLAAMPATMRQLQASH